MKSFHFETLATNSRFGVGLLSTVVQVICCRTLGSLSSVQFSSVQSLSHVWLFATLLMIVPARLLCPWGSPGKNTGVGCYVLLQRIFLTQGLNLHLLCLWHWQAGSLPLAPPGTDISHWSQWSYRFTPYLSLPSLLPCKADLYGLRCLYSLTSSYVWLVKISDRRV